MRSSRTRARDPGHLRSGHLVEIPLLCRPHTQVLGGAEAAQYEEGHRKGADRREAAEPWQSARTWKPRCHRGVASEHGDQHEHAGIGGAERVAGVCGQRVRHAARPVAAPAECRVNLEVADVRGGRGRAVHVGQALGRRDAADHAGPIIHHTHVPAVALEPVQREEIRLPAHTQGEPGPHGAGRGQGEQPGVVGGRGAARSVVIHGTKLDARGQAPVKLRCRP